MQGGARPGRTRRPWVFVGIGIAVAALTFVAVGPPGVLLQHVTVCQLGAEIGHYVIWTPLTLLNKEVAMNVSAAQFAWNYTFSSGSLTVGALPSEPEGAAEGEGDFNSWGGLHVSFQDHNWTF
jgi:hypothetical protein